MADWAFFFKVMVTGNATCFYKNLNVVAFLWGGLSNQTEGLQLLKTERAKVLKESFPPTVSDLLENYKLVVARNEELEGIIIRKKLLIKRLVNLVIAAIRRRVKLMQTYFTQRAAK